VSAGVEFWLIDGARGGANGSVFYLEQLRDVLWVYAPEVLSEAFQGAYYE
jgi:hypothetical protein